MSLDEQKLEKLRARIVRNYRKRNNCPARDEIRAYAAGTLTNEAERQRIERHLDAENCLLCRLDARYGQDPEQEARGRSNLRKLLGGLLAIVLYFIRGSKRATDEAGASASTFKQAAAFGPAVALLGVCAAGIAAGMCMIRASETTDSRTATPVYRATLRQALALSSTPLAATTTAYRSALWRPTVFGFTGFIKPFSSTRVHIAANSPSTKGRIVLIKIKKIDETTLAPASEAAARAGAVYYAVQREETVTVEVSGAVPPGARLYPIIRARGGAWLVEEGVVLRSSRGGEVKVPVEFGPQDAELAIYDCRFLVDTDILPREPVSDEVLNGRGVLGGSSIIRVKRRSTTTPTLAITHVNGVDNYGGDSELTWVYDEAPIRIGASKIPIGARIGIVIQPVMPLNESRWVQMDDLTAPGEINGHFGDPEYHHFHRFAITGFLVESLDDFPPRGVEIGPVEWESYRRKFLATSTPAVVIKAGDQFSIDALGNRKPSQTGFTPIDTHSDISGSLDRPLTGKERIWVVCIPFDGTAPWIATPVAATPDSYWAAKAVQFWNGRSKKFKIVAAISDEDATKIPTDQIRFWINQVKHSVNSVDTQIRTQQLDQAAR
jgi:hypothetical protein